jgi:hypothetical protein
MKTLLEYIFPRWIPRAEEIHIRLYNIRIGRIGRG